MDSLSRIEKKTKKKKGFFAIGCNTILFSRYITDAYILALTKDFMAPEGYNLLALIDGIIEEDEGKKLKERMDKTYFYFQHLNGKSPGPLFVNHEKGVYQIDR